MLPHTRAYDSSHHKVLRRKRRDGPFPGDMDYLEFLHKLVGSHEAKTAFEQAIEIAVLVYEDVLSIHNQRTTRAIRTRQALYCGLSEGVGKSFVLITQSKLAGTCWSSMSCLSIPSNTSSWSIKKSLCILMILNYYCQPLWRS